MNRAHGQRVTCCPPESQSKIMTDIAQIQRFFKLSRNLKYDEAQMRKLHSCLTLQNITFLVVVT